MHLQRHVGAVSSEVPITPRPWPAPTRRAAFIRSVILAVSSLLIIGVLFAVYQYSTGVAKPTHPPRIASGPDDGLPPDPTASGASALAEQRPAVNVAGSNVGAGSKIAIRLYEPDSNRATLELEVTSWKPTGAGRDEFHLVAPEIRLRAPEGQLIRVTADEGWMQLVKRSGGAFEPKSGRLVGHVRMDVDRLTQQQRSPASAGGTGPPRPEDLIHAEFEEATFDMEQASVETDQAFSVRMTEAEVSGVGLRLRYNDVDSRMENFEILRGGLARIRTFAEILGTPEADAGQEASASATQQALVESESTTPQSPPEPQAPTSAGTTPKDGIPWFIEDAPAKKRTHPVQTYAAEVNGEVSIEQVAQGESSWRLATPQVRVLFDFGQEHREEARSRQRPGSGRTDSASPDKGNEIKPEATTPAAAGEDSGHVEFRWTGRLALTPVLPPESPPPQRRRMHLIAGGGEVLFEDRRAKVSCAKLEVHRETQELWVWGDEHRPAILTTDTCAELVAPAIHVDRSAGYARVDGPATLSDFREDSAASSTGDRGSGARPPVGISVRFQDSAELTIGKYLRQRVDPKSQTEAEVPTEYIASATMLGRVVMGQGSDLIMGESVDFQFDPPLAPGAFAENIRAVRATRDVLMVRGSDRTSCRSLDVRFARGPDQRMWPRFAVADGDVVITQAGGTITADDRIEMEMIAVPVAKKPFVLSEARLVALRRGLDPATIDWDKVRDQYEQTTEYQTGLKTLDAAGRVRIVDPAQGVSIQAAAVACDFVNGADLRTAHLEALPGEEASAKLGEMSVTGPRIEVDAPRQRIEVHGAGQATLVSYQGLDGAKNDTPQDTTVRWQKQMLFRGDENQARFEGEVRAVTLRRPSPPPTWLDRLTPSRAREKHESGRFEGESMVIELADVPPEPTPPNAAPAKWGILQPLVDRVSAEQPSPRLQIRKEPITAMIEGRVIGEFVEKEPATQAVRSRVHVESSKVTADLRGRQIIVPQKGTLLIEDYAPSGTIAQTQASAGDFFNSGLPSLPSQTMIHWAGSMTYDARNGHAEMLQDVQLAHRAGAKMALLGELGSLANSRAGSSTASGRQVDLRSDSLAVGFDVTGQQGGVPAVGRGVGGLNMKDVRRFEATGRVFLDTEQLSIEADRIVKFAESAALMIYGLGGQDAHLYIKPSESRMTAPGFAYHFDTGRIEVREGRAQGRQ